MPWAVVEFLDRGEVEAVPTNWLYDEAKKCYWPEKSFRQSDLIKKQAEPDTNSWATYSVRVFNSYGKFYLSLQSTFVRYTLFLGE